MVQKFDDAKIIKAGDVPGQTDASGVETGEAGRYYTRMQYKERQFLRAKDFVAEQDYHIEKMRDHNKALHTYGVCESEAGGVEGLQISIAPGAQYAKCVVVSKGMAIDRLGNTILLTQNEILDLSSSCVTGNAYTANVYLYIAYGEANASDAEFNLDEGGFSGCTRLVEKPKFKVSASSDANTDPRYLLLASITRDATGKITSFNNKPLGRETAGVKMSQVGSVAIADGAVQARHLAPGAAIGNITDNSLNGSKLVNASVTSAKLAANTAAENINNAISTTTISGNKITDGTVLGTKLVAGTITSTQLTSGAALANIQDGTISGAKLAANAAATNINSASSATTISGAKITAGSVTNTQLQSGAAIANIADGTIPSAKLATGATSGAVATTNIRDSAVTTAKIADSAVTNAKIGIDSIQIDRLRRVYSERKDANINCYMVNYPLTYSTMLHTYTGYNDPLLSRPYRILILPYQGVAGNSSLLHGYNTFLRVTSEEIRYQQGLIYHFVEVTAQTFTGTFNHYFSLQIVFFG